MAFRHSSIIYYKHAIFSAQDIALCNTNVQYMPRAILRRLAAFHFESRRFFPSWTTMAIILKMNNQSKVGNKWV